MCPLVDCSPRASREADLVACASVPAEKFCIFLIEEFISCGIWFSARGYLVRKACRHMLVNMSHALFYGHEVRIFERTVISPSSPPIYSRCFELSYYTGPIPKMVLTSSTLILGLSVCECFLLCVYWSVFAAISVHIQAEDK